MCHSLGVFGFTNFNYKPVYINDTGHKQDSTDSVNGGLVASDDFKQLETV